MSNNTKFTKGPWFYARSTDGALVELGTEVNHQSGDGIIYMQGDHDNAQLIACAPEMYYLLNKLQIEGGLGIARHREIDRILAKARGEK